MLETKSPFLNLVTEGTLDKGKINRKEMQKSIFIQNVDWV